MEARVLTLPLKKKWFDMIKSGVKTEEYRELKAYYFSRLCNQVYTDQFFEPLPFTSYVAKKFDRLVFTCGYPKKGDTSKRLEFMKPRINIGYGKLEWGAEPGRRYFVITWGEEA